MVYFYSVVTDNTAEILSSTGLDHINQNNLGSAGGWNSGIKYALKNKFDYVWLMDDDGYPDQDALKILLHNVDPFDTLSAYILTFYSSTVPLFSLYKITHVVHLL